MIGRHMPDTANRGADRIEADGVHVLQRHEHGHAARAGAVALMLQANPR
jgi:hypothetical protein